MDDLIRRQDAIDAIIAWTVEDRPDVEMPTDLVDRVNALPSAQPKTSRIENTLHGKSAEEQYDFIRWLMHDYGMQFTDTRTAVIEWLRGEHNG